MTYIIYGIPNCGTVRKVLDWMSLHQISYQFHNYKTQSLTPDILEGWCKQVGWEQILNKSGTTYKTLNEEQKAEIIDTSSASKFLLHNLSGIRRPIITDQNNNIKAIRFDETHYETTFLNK